MRISGSAGKRIAINTTVAYTRSIIGMLLVLFSNRWALASLGVEDFGIYNVIGTIMVIIVFLNTVLANSDSRFFSLAIGNGDNIELNKLFNVFFFLHIIIPTVVIIIGYFIGLWAIYNVLVIPSDRIDSAIVIFRIVMVSSFLSMITVPFSTLLIAYQDIIEYAIIELLQSVLIFLSAFLLRFSFITDDKLILYTILMSSSYIVTYVLMIVVARTKYSCTKIQVSFLWDKSRSAEILNYSFWNMLGEIGHLVRTQGIAVVVNLLWGPKGNAALGIANQVSVQASNLTNAMATSISPEIYRRVGEGDKSAIKLSNYASRIGLLLIFILGVPLIFNIDSILELWLINVPESTAGLCVCFIIMYMIEKISLGQLFYLRAKGAVTVVNILIFVFYSMSVVFPYCGLSQLGIVCIGISCVISMTLSRLSVIYCVKKYVDYEMRPYYWNTILPASCLIIVVIICYLSGLGFYTSSIWILLLDVFVLFVVALLVSFYSLFTGDERERIVKTLFDKIRVLYSRKDDFE